jgi:predicted TIM-barrel fold metal-dependent hydrolase
LNPQSAMDKPQSAIRNPQSAMRVCDTHCHFFSSRFLELLTKDRADLPAGDRAVAVATLLGWDPPGTPDTLADRWSAEMSRHGLTRCALIASLPGDEESVATAVARHPHEFVGFFMFNPTLPDAHQRLVRALGELKLRAVALFPAMHRYRVDDEVVAKVFDAAAAHGAAVFVHCGVLSVGVRKKLGLPSPFDFRLGDPLAVAAVAQRYPAVPVIIPHFGAGFLREALMAAEQSPNVHLDTSSSNGWMKYYPGLTLEAVFRQALSVLGPDRLLFGTDSSFFPRGWQTSIFDAQTTALETIGVSQDDRAKILGGNFERLFPDV